MYYIAVKKDQHYIEHHEKQVPWDEVSRVVQRAAKYMRKKGDKIEIEFEGYYLLCEIRNNNLYVINAKRNN